MGRGKTRGAGRDELEEEGWGEISIYREGVNNEQGWGDGRVDLTSRYEIELRIELEEEMGERIEEKGKGQDPRGSMGEGRRGKIKIKMLGTDVRLEQARKGIGDVKT